jgi:hypothetical protein
LSVLRFIPCYNFSEVSGSGLGRGRIASAMLVTRFPLTSIVSNRGPQYAVFKASYKVVYVPIVSTFTAVLGVARILSIELMSTVAKFSIL